MKKNSSRTYTRLILLTVPGLCPGATHPYIDEFPELLSNSNI